MSGRSSRSRLLALSLAALVAIPLYAVAAPLRSKNDHPEAKKEKSEAPAPDSSSAAPYEPDLLRLSEIIGALAYLRNLCGAQDGDRWREEMSTLLAAQGDSKMQRERLAGAYNKGFRDYEIIYHSCTPNAHAVISSYLAEGSKLTRDVTSRYGGS
jgi:uncharacterized protein (TIGR02301 family)